MTDYLCDGCGGITEMGIRIDIGGEQMWACPDCFDYYKNNAQ